MNIRHSFIHEQMSRINEELMPKLKKRLEKATNPWERSIIKIDMEQNTELLQSLERYLHKQEKLEREEMDIWEAETSDPFFDY